MGRAPCCDKVGLKKGRWTVEEDETLTKYIQANGEGSWRSLPKNAGLLRCGKSCRLRWINYLKSDLKRGNISAQEEDIIIKLHASLGNKWSVIAGQLAGRTDNEIKNYWNSHLSRKIDTFRRPNSEPLPSSILLMNLGATAASSKTRKGGGGRTSRAAMQKNKTSKTGETKSHPQSVLETNGNLGMPVSDQEEAIILGFGEKKEEGNSMVCCPTSDIDDVQTCDQLMGPLHEEGGLLSFHDINEGDNNNNVEFFVSNEISESLEILGGTLSSNEGSINGGGEKMYSSWPSLTSKNMEEDGKIDWEWEEFVNEMNMWTNNEEKDDDKQQEEILSWLWDNDDNIINISEDQGDDNNIQGMESSEEKDALVAWLFS